MAILIIDGLKVVQVQQAQGQGTVFTLGTSDRVASPYAFLRKLRSSCGVMLGNTIRRLLRGSMSR